MTTDETMKKKTGSTLNDKLRKIREAFIRQLPSQLFGLREAYGVLLRQGGEEPNLEDLHRRLHTLRGGSSSFGLSELAAVAAEGEQTAGGAMRGETPLDQAWQQQMQDHLARLQQAADQIEMSTATDFQVPELAPLRKSTVERKRKLIYLCEDDEHLCRTLTSQLQCFGFEVAAFGELEQLRQAVLKTVPDAVIMDIVFPDRPLGGTELMTEFHLGGLKIPTLFVSAREDLPARLAAVRAGADAYFVKPVNTADLCATLTTLTRVEEPEPYQVLIIDDDPQLAAYHAEILERAGMSTLTVTDPMRSLEALGAFKPDLILMDMYMPGCNGMELARVIRQDQTFLSVPIVYLSTETDSDKQLNAIYMGGDEFLTKPIKPHNLIGSVAVRAERMKIMRSQMIRDAMTGLYNHTASKEQLNFLIGTARRNQTGLCFALLDVDFFKSVNDTHGHPVGDQVLITLAKLLKQRLRDTDIVGRFGGEEFVTILPGCNLDQAVIIMNNLRQSYAEIEFQAPAAAFSSTFSCGLVSLADCDDATAIYQAADEALYQAKESGRNQVVAWRKPE